MARHISGLLHTVDVDPAMVLRTQQRLGEHGATNVRVVERDIVSDGFVVPVGSQDACLPLNSLHGEESVALLHQGRAILRASGRAYVIDRRYDSSTPRGPAMSIRPKPEQCLAWAETVGFWLLSEPVIDLPPYHWGMVLGR